MATITYKGDYWGIGEMLHSPWLLADLRRRAVAVKAAAAATAPIGKASDGDESPGTFAASFQVHSRIRPDRNGPGHYIVFDVVSTDPLGYVKEMGSYRVHRPKIGTAPRDEFEASLLSASQDNIGVTRVGGSHTLRRALDAARL